jgi:hypothetical protein
MSAADPVRIRRATEVPNPWAAEPVNRDEVGRPGLDPGTLGLEGEKP